MPGAAAAGVLDELFFDEPPQPAAASAKLATATAVKVRPGATYFTLKLTCAEAPALLWSLLASCTESVCLPFGRPLYLMPVVTDGEYLPVTPSFLASRPFAPEYFG